MDREGVVSPPVTPYYLRVAEDAVRKFPHGSPPYRFVRALREHNIAATGMWEMAVERALAEGAKAYGLYQQRRQLVSAAEARFLARDPAAAARAGMS